MAVLGRRVVNPLEGLLRQGLTPERLAFSLALGAALGLFPVIGATTLLCAGAGAWFRLNHPALQLANYLVYPVQLPLILVFVRLGEGLLGASPVPFSVSELLAAFRADPFVFLRQFGATGLHGVLGWFLAAPALAALLYAACLFPLRAAAARLALRPIAGAEVA